MTSASALRPPLAYRSATLLSLLNSLLLRVEGLPIALLRPLPQNFDAERDDVDLLISHEQRSRLLEIAFKATATEHFHFRVLQSCAEKVQLTFWDERCEESLKVDLWSSFSQIPNHRRKAISAERLLALHAGHSTAIQKGPADDSILLEAAVRLRSDIEFCLLILHLVVRKKSLATTVTRERLDSAFENLKSFSLTESPERIDGLPELLQVAESTRFSNVLSQQHVQLAESHLFRELAKADLSDAQPFLDFRKPGRTICRARRWIAQQAPCIVIIGSDGAGKTTICKSLVAACPSSIVPMVAKKLYRRSLIYRISTGLAKRIGIERGLFDEQHCIWLTLRAATAFWMVSVWHMTKQAMRALLKIKRSRIMLLDRSIAGFLIQDRKSQNPRLHPQAESLERVLPPSTTVLLSVSFEKLSLRKQEMSYLGHQLYQRILFEQALRQSPVDLIVLSNSGNSDGAVRSIQSILKLDYSLAEAEAKSQAESAA